ncbi:Mob1/phocein family protein [Teladorsagia circumcincta]|uniref:Mob1/phocein family protein n=1 Tax=Teladorsagia circumcincta TaxID=45464 RepID=A0A2G9V580_TELCI|nr:Mob1/phocein family protein [Teladorsagia circumcincta]
MTADVVSHPPVSASDSGRFTSIRTVLGEWKQLFDGCNFIKRKERSRSRRRDVKDAKTKRVASASVAQRSSTRKSQSTELCVCDSIEDHVIEKFTALPPGIDPREWLATHTLALFDHVNALCGSLSELCTPATCQYMSYPGTAKAYYIDERGKRHLYSAMQYMDCVMSFCEKASRSEELFPTKYGNQFSGDFESHIRRVIRLLWHCCGHLALKHWDELGQLELRPQCALVMAHLSKLSKTFALLDSKDQQLINNMVQTIRPSHIASSGCGDDTGGATSQRWSRIPSSKSGSWGGHPTPAVLTCKPYAQTC